MRKKYSKSPFKRANNEHEFMFTEGYCYVLATVISKEFDLEIWACDEHALVKTTCDYFLDYTGVYKDLRAIELRQWHGEWKLITNPEKYFKEWCQWEPDEKEAFLVAEDLVKNKIKKTYFHHFVGASVCV